MLQSPTSLVVPETEHVNGYPFLLDGKFFNSLVEVTELIHAHRQDSPVGIVVLYNFFLVLR